MEIFIKYRFISFLVSLFLFSSLQLIRPRRTFMRKRYIISINNLLLMAFNNLVVFMIVLIPLKASVIASENNFGLLNFLNITPYIGILVSVVILDITIYFQHRFFHKIDFLWKLHRVHHVDPMLDTTSGLRFHPLEIVISNFIKVSIVFLIGAPVLGVVIFEIILNVTALFNHSNFKINSKLEIVLRVFLITPDLHLIHHSVKLSEMNSNFGFSVPWWDKIFGTYKSEPSNDYSTMKLGITNMPTMKYILLPYLLVYPFKD